MTFPWIRLWVEARTDPKLASLTDAQHRAWLHLLCFASEQPSRGKIVGLGLRLVAVQAARGDAELLRSTCEALAALKVVTADLSDPEAVSIEFLNFARRQRDKPSDRPSRVAERVAKHRDRRRNAGAESAPEGDAGETPCNAPVTPVKRPCNAPVTGAPLHSERNDKAADSGASPDPESGSEPPLACGGAPAELIQFKNTEPEPDAGAGGGAGGPYGSHEECIRVARELFGGEAAGAVSRARNRIAGQTEGADELPRWDAFVAALRKVDHDSRQPGFTAKDSLVGWCCWQAQEWVALGEIPDDPVAVKGKFEPTPVPPPVKLLPGSEARYGRGPRPPVAPGQSLAERWFRATGNTLSEGRTGTCRP